MTFTIKQSDGSWHYQLFNSRGELLLESGPYNHEYEVIDATNKLRTLMEADDVYRYIQERI